MNEILSKDNQWIKLAGSLKHKKGRMEHKCLLVEGFRLMEEAARQRIKGVICFVNEAAQKRANFPDLQKNGEALGWQFYAVADGVYDKIKDTQTPQGIAAILPFFEYSLKQLAAVIGKEPVLFLESIQDPGNLGTIIRTAAAANTAAIFLSPDSVDLYNSKTLRSAMGAVFKIPVVQNVTEEDLIQFCREQGRLLMGTTPHGTHSYAEADYRTPVVLAFGNEGAGLTDTIMGKCGELITIPMRRDTESLNLSISVGLVLYKAWECQGFEEGKRIE